MVSIRQLELRDMPAALGLCRAARWNQIEKDWLLFLEYNSLGCFAAVGENDNVMGTVATIRYGAEKAWIGMVLVDPAERKKGIGTALLHRAIESLKDIPCILLDATAAGREVYLKLGFKDLYPIVRLFRPAKLSNLAIKNTSTQPIDMEWIGKKDKRVFASDRNFLLNEFFIRCPQLACSDESTGAYCFGRDGYNYFHIGPVVADDVDQAKHIFSCALKNCNGREVITDVPDHSTEWLNWLRENGFSEQRSFIRMYFGNIQSAEEFSKIFAIAGPEFG